LVLLSQSSLHTFLSVALSIPDKFLTVVVSKALEVNYPLSNRFVSPSSFARELSARIGLEATLVSSDSVANNDQYFLVALKDFHARQIGSIAVSRPTVEIELQRVDAQIERMTSFLAGVALLFFAVIAAFRVVTLANILARIVLSSALLWVLRYAWLVLEFPHVTVGTSLFDPAIYGTPFGYGITESIGETLITVVVLFLNASCAAYWLVRRQLEDVQQTIVRTTPWAIALLPVIVALFLWLTHGFGEAMRSLVFDSTLRFHDPTVVLPAPLVLVMHLNILFLTLTYIAVVVVMQLLMLRIVRNSIRRRPSFSLELLAVFSVFVFLWIALQFLPLAPKFPVYYPLLAFGICGLLTLGLERQKRGLAASAIHAKTLAVVMAAALLLAMPLLDHKLHQKDREHLQLVADDLLRPVDSWLSLVINEGMSVAMERDDLLQSATDNQQAGHSDVAFTLWSQTLLGREGYNSAIVLYDAVGNETSRFAVGMTSFEQSEMLKAMFNAEEEVLQVVDRTVPGGTVKYYGAWSTVRDTGGTPAGFTALMLSASQRALFRAEAPEPLRTITRERFETDFRELSLAEFRDGILTTTNNASLYRGMMLDEEVYQSVLSQPGRFLWRAEVIEGQEYEALYVRDDN
ncbi:MAG: hypothetical protein ACRDGA_03245, partial [Bacteroidota bacterium]